MDEGVERHPGDGWAVLAFETAAGFEGWLDEHAGEAPGVWVKFAKQGRGIPSLTLPEAIEVAMCFGWVDSKMHRYDDDYYVVRHQPRRRKSTWSARNKEIAERLVAQGRMRPAGLAEVAAAKADGRWDAR